MFAGNRDPREQVARLALIFFTLAVVSGILIFAVETPGRSMLHGVFAITVALFLVAFVRLIKDGAARSINRTGDPATASRTDDEQEDEKRR